MTPPTTEMITSKEVRMGLGEALRRLLDIEIRYRHGGSTEGLARERNLLLQALNRVEIQLGFDCNRDGVPDTVEIFQQAAETSCCRITDLSGVAPAPDAPPLIEIPSRIGGERWTTEPSRVPGDSASRIILSGDEKAKPGLFSRIFGSSTEKDTKK